MSVTASAAAVQRSRHEREYVTVIHLTDLHFPTSGKESRREVDLNPAFKSGKDGQEQRDNLIEAIKSHKPDLVCVTGDLADSPMKSFRPWNSRRETDALTTFRTVTRFLNEICAPRGDGGDQQFSCPLFVVPGNHDVRVQGFLINNASALLKLAFEKVFPENAVYTDSAPCRAGALCFGFSGKSPMLVRVIGLDSNDTDRALNAATGHLSDKERDKLKQFDTRLECDPANRDKAGAVPNPSEFRLCLVHHHPLPVAGSEKRPNEAVRLDGHSGTLFSKSWRRVKNWFGGVVPAGMGEQGVVFKRAGTFLQDAHKYNVDLILHGHQHYPQTTIVRYPKKGDGDYPMMVVGGGSLGEKTEDTWRYNVIKLFRSGNIEVTEMSRSASHNVLDYSPTVIANLYSDDSYRLVQKKWMLDNLRQEAAGNVGNAEGFGLATAAQIVKHVKIQSDGSADCTITLRALRATLDDVEKLPIAFRVSNHSTTTRPLVSALQWTQSKPVLEATTDTVEGSEKNRWCLTIKPALRKNDRQVIAYKYSADNAFDFVTEFSKPRHRDEYLEKGFEHSGFICKAVQCDRLILIVEFPKYLRPSSSPEVIAYDSEKLVDSEERERGSKSFYYECDEDQTPVARVTIDHPLPGYTYGFKWPLISKADHEDAHFEKEYVEIARGLANFKAKFDSEKTQCLEKLLKELMSTYRQINDQEVKKLLPEVPSDVAVSLFFLCLGLEQTGLATNALLKRVACFPSVKSESHAWVAGEGVVGKAHRLAGPYCVPNKDGMRAYVQRGKKAHTAMWAVPLKIPRSKPKTSQKASPVYAVLCFDSRMWEPTNGKLEVPGIESAIEKWNCELHSVLQKWREETGGEGRSIATS